MYSGFFTKVMALRETDPFADFSFLQDVYSDNKICAYDFLHGHCLSFAVALSRRYGYAIDTVCDKNNDLIHAYCVAEVNNQNYYIDIRGTTTDLSLFFDDFEDEICIENGEISQSMQDEGLLEVYHYTCTADYIARNRFSWAHIDDAGDFIANYIDFYNLSPLFPRKKPDLSHIIESAQAKTCLASGSQSEIKIFYHVTPMENVPSISKEGLSPRIGPRSIDYGEKTPAIYLFPDLVSTEDALMNWLGEWYEQQYDEDYELAILKVCLPDGFPVSSSKAAWEFVCKRLIPPECITFYNENGQKLSAPNSSGRQAGTDPER